MEFLPSIKSGFGFQRRVSHWPMKPVQFSMWRVSRLVADAEGGSVISIVRGREQINAVVVARREADGLAFGDEGVGVVSSADGEVELDAVEVDGGGKHFRGESVALGVKAAGGVSVVGA